jgi:hypothetical protein
VMPTCPKCGEVFKAPTARAAAPVSLPFDRPTLDARNAILTAVWRCVQPVIGRGATATGWRQRNAKTARELAELGFTADVVVRAWQMASKDYGEPIRELGPVQRFIERAAADRAQRAEA